MSSFGACPGTCSAGQPSLELRDLPAFAFQSAGIKGVCRHCVAGRVLKVPSIYDCLMYNGAEYFKACLLSICISSPEDSLFRSIVYFWLACFLDTKFLSCVVGINPMSGTLAFRHLCWLALRVLTECVISCSHYVGLFLCTRTISPHISQALLTFLSSPPINLPHEFCCMVWLYVTSATFKHVTHGTP